MKSMRKAIFGAAAAFALALGCTAFATQTTKVNAAAANGSASVLSIDNSNFENKIQGGQTEYVYFGHDLVVGDTTQAVDTPMKWRVLTKNDTKYGRGKNLLLQTESVYNFSYNNSASFDAVFWGTSLVRAMLNGGTTTNGDSIQYYNAANGTLNTWANPFVNKIAVSGDSDFLNAIQGTNPYITRLQYWGYLSPVISADTLNFDYAFTNANATVTRSMDADVTGGNSRVVGDKVSGDRMFYLDIEDYCNTPAYGFIGSTTGKTYFEEIADYNSAYTFTNWKNGYPTYIASNGLISDALKVDAGFYNTLRDPIYAVSNTQSAVTAATIYGVYNSGVYNCGNMLGAYPLNSAANARPATVLDLTQVVYANGSVGNVGSTFTDVSGSSTVKPEYKLYIKDSAYSNSGFKPIVTSANGKVKVTFKNNSGKAGNVVVLLQDKNATDGSVAYQAVIPMSGGSAEQSVEFNLPSGLVYKNYIPTVMLTSANTTSSASMATESVYATYTQDGIIIPEDISGMEYAVNTNHWLDGLNLKAVGGTTPDAPVWIDQSMHCDSSVISVKKIMYKSFEDGAAEEDKTADGTTKIINAGVYTITFEIVDPNTFHWTDGTTDDKSFKITVDRKKPNVTAAFKETLPANLYVSYNDGKLPDLKNSASNATAGTIGWQEGQSPSATNTTYYWEFTPDDTVNYLKITGKSDDTKITVPYKTQSISKLEITLNKVIDENNEETADDVKIYDAFTLTDGDYSLKNYITVKAVYQDGITKDTLGSSDYVLSRKDGQPKLSEGSVTIRAKQASGTKTGELTITVLKSVVEEIEATYNDNGTALSYPCTEDDIKENLEVIARWNYSENDFLDVDNDDVTIEGDIVAGAAGDVELTVKYGEKTFKIYPQIDKGELDMSGVSVKTETTGVTGSDEAYSFTYDKDVTVSFATDGDVKNANGDTVAATGTLSYEKKNASGAWVACTASDLKNAGEYRIKATYAPDDTDNYEIASGDEVVTVTLKVDKADYPDADKIKFEGKSVTYTGSGQSIAATDVPDGVTVTYVYNNGTPQSTPVEFTEINENGYEVTAKFTHSDTNYKEIADKTAKLIISAKPVHDMSGTEFKPSTGSGLTDDGNGGFKGTFNPDGGFGLGIDPDTLPEGVTVTGTVIKKLKPNGNPANEEDWEVVPEIKDAGDYKVEVSFDGGDDHAEVQDMVTTVTIGKADVEMDGTSFKPAGTNGSGLKPDGNGGYTGTYNPDGSFELEIDTGTLPDGVTPKAPVYMKLKDGGNPENPEDWEVVSEVKEVGEYKVVVDFEPTDKDNYNEIDPIEVKLTISDKTLTGVSVNVEEGVKFTAESTLEDLKAKLSAEIEYNNGTKEEVKVEDLIITCEGLQENGKLEVGRQVITVVYKDGVNEFKTTIEIVVEKAKVALPVYKGTLSYTGTELKPTANDFDGYNAEIMSFVESKTVAGMNAGTYKAVFALNDPDRYEWASATTLKKSVFAAVVYDGEVTLEANEAAVEWNIAKAVITATKAQGKLPVFASESFKGSLAEVVGLKYYTDETCTEEIAADALGYNTSYYVRAELLDSDNFELDETATDLTTTPFEYLTPEKELTVWDKIVNFLKANWLWLVIAVVALILLITIIACAVHASRKKRIREERRLAEEKAERERKEEERERKEEERRQREEERRREEREERMMRMSQPQMQMPSMMPQMMQMPQSMPQQVQPMVTGGGNAGGSISPELLAIITGMNGKIEKLQSDVAANELSATREALAQARNELMLERMHGNKSSEGQVMAGMTAATLAEIVTAAMEKVLDSRDKTVVQQTAEKPESGAASAATTQVPPDAVMTTVTTTKIDTTKKQAQTAARPVVRNYVAPMPVDDGRVFDVGGFYKPADPLTDLNLDEEEKKD